MHMRTGRFFNRNWVVLTIIFVVVGAGISSWAATLEFGMDSTGLQHGIDTGAKFIIYKDDTTIYCLNGSTGIELTSNADAATVIQYAVDNLPISYEASSGTHHKGKIIIKHGWYSISQQINITEDNCIIEGEDAFQTQLMAESGVKNILNISEKGTGDGYINGIVIRNLHLRVADGHTSNQYIGVNAYKAYYLHCENLVFDNASRCINLTQCISTVVHHIISENQNNTIYATNCQRLKIIDVNAETQHGATLYDLVLYGGAYNIIDKITIYNSEGGGINIVSCPTEITNLFFRETGRIGLRMANNYNTMISNCVIEDASDNAVNSYDAVVITGATSKNITLSNINVYGDCRYGVYVNADVTKETIAMNNCILNATTSGLYDSNNKIQQGSNIIDNIHVTCLSTTNSTLSSDFNGETWFNTATNVLYVYNGTAWVSTTLT